MKKKIYKFATGLLVIGVLLLWITIKNIGDKKIDMLNTKIAIKTLLYNDTINAEFRVPSSISKEFVGNINNIMLNKTISNVSIFDKIYVVKKLPNDNFKVIYNSGKIVITQPDSSNRVFIKTLNN